MYAEDYTITKEINEMMEIFDTLDGNKQLELFGILLEKIENGEIEVKGKPVYPEQIAIDDAYTCYATILDLISKD